MRPAIGTLRVISLSISAFFFIRTSTLAQSDSAVSPRDYLAATVAYLSSRTITMSPNNGKPDTNDVCGTGFFITDNVWLVLVTAEHVAKELGPSPQLTIWVPGDRALSMPLSRFSHGIKPGWLFDDTADVAAIWLDLDQSTAPYFKKHACLLSLVEERRRAPSRDLSLLIMGFPLCLGWEEYFSPISQEFKTVSGLLTLPRGDTKRPEPFYLCSVPVAGGLSGAPVFETPGANNVAGGLSIGGRLAIVGLVHGVVSDRTGGKFSAIVPSWFIAKTVKRLLEIK
jgi:hypothetical protein